ncbi:MAG: cob(I)yrinic acid a,c-diamide adenosyltransferase [Cyclobacteriaceae bacterium]
MSAKLYTKTGDKGKTSLLGGKKVSKANLRIEAYGNVDELNSFLGYLKDQKEVENRLKQQIYWIQEHLFTIGSALATEPGFSGFELPKISVTEVNQLEVWIDKFDTEVPPLKNFILPGGHPVVSLSHVCRSVCRRTERSIISLAENAEVEEVIIQFMNRLSDYLFIFARALGQQLNAPEIPWSPNAED